MPLNQPERDFATANENDIAIDAGRHFLQSEIRDSGGFAHWISRFNAIPEFQIRDAFEWVVGIGLAKENVDFFVEFMIRRRAKLPSIIEQHSEKFPSLDLGLGSPIAWS
jgi:hypothetical protein